MKKIFLIFSLSILLLFTLTSCGREGGSYYALSRVKSQVKNDYISFGYGGIVKNNKYDKLTYQKLFDEKNVSIDKVKKIDDYIYLLGKSDDNICFSKYNPNEDNYDNYKISQKDVKSFYSWILDDGFLVITYKEDYIDMLYHIDFDFNVTSQMLTDDQEILTGYVASEEYGVFPEYLKLGDTEKMLRNIWIYKDNNIYSVNVNLNYSLSYFAQYEYIYDNYFVITTAGKQMIVFVYNLETDEIVYEVNNQLYYDNSVIDYLEAKFKEEENKIDYIYNDIPSMPDLESVNNYSSINKIIKKYNNNAKISYSYEFDNNDGNLYYLVRTKVKIYSIIITDGGMTYNKQLDPTYIFMYNEQENKISYLGYSMDSLLLLYVN